jgi:isopentenyldiphosphate isomerase
MEIFDLFDYERNLLDLTMERGGIQPENTYRSVVHVCVFNKAGQMLIQQRQSFKKGWANLWDITVGGHTDTGEKPIQSAARELLEELGLHYDFEGVRPHLTINFAAGFDDCYIIEKDVEISQLTLQYEEVQAAKWASLEDIFDMIDTGEFIPYHKSYIELLFKLKSKRGVHNS